MIPYLPDFGKTISPSHISLWLKGIVGPGIARRFGSLLVGELKVNWQKTIMAFLSQSQQSGLHPKRGFIAIKLVLFWRSQSWLPIKPNHLSVLLVLIACAKPRLPSTVWRQIERGWAPQVWNSLKWNTSRRNRTKMKSRHTSTALSLTHDNQNNRDFKSRLFSWRMECLV